VAGRSKVPSATTHYHFKTKGVLAEAVIASHDAALRNRFTSWAVANRAPNEPGSS
jgi:hypothetical protein